MAKAVEAFRTISEVADLLEIPKHVLRFWEAKFPQVRPMKRGGGRRYYRPTDVALLRGIRHLLQAEGYTIKGAQKVLRDQGVDYVKEQGGAETPVAPAATTSTLEKPVDKVRISAPTGHRHQPREERTKRGSARRLPRAAAAPLDDERRRQIEQALKHLEACRSLLLADVNGSSAATGAASPPGK